MRGRRRCRHETTDESELCLYFYLCEDQREFFGECALILRSEDTSCLDNDDMLKSVNSVWCSERLVSTDCLWYFSCMNKRCCPAGWCRRLLLRNTHAAFKCRQGKQDCKLKLSESRADRRWFPLFTQYFIQSSLFILLYLQCWFHLEDFLNQKVEESDKSLRTARCSAAWKNQNPQSVYWCEE